MRCAFEAFCQRSARHDIVVGTAWDVHERSQGALDQL